MFFLVQCQTVSMQPLLIFPESHKNVTTALSRWCQYHTACWLPVLMLWYLITGYWLLVPSVLWRCWLCGRKGIRPIKTEWWGTGVVICLEQGADLHMAQLMPLPLTVSCSSKIQIGFTFLVLADLGTPRKRAVKRVCVYSIMLSHSNTAPNTGWY